MQYFICEAKFNKDLNLINLTFDKENGDYVVLGSAIGKHLNFYIQYLPVLNMLCCFCNLHLISR